MATTWRISAAFAWQKLTSNCLPPCSGALFFKACVVSCSFHSNETQRRAIERLGCCAHALSLTLGGVSRRLRGEGLRDAQLLGGAVLQRLHVRCGARRHLALRLPRVLRRYVGRGSIWRGEGAGVKGNMYPPKLRRTVVLCPTV